MNEQLNEALSIMLTGMVSVFLFLSLLICAMLLLRRFIVEVEPQQSVKRAKAKAAGSSPTSQQLAAITAAVHHYRGTKS